MTSSTALPTVPQPLTFCFIQTVSVRAEFFRPVSDGTSSIKTLSVVTNVKNKFSPHLRALHLFETIDEFLASQI